MNSKTEKITPEHLFLNRRNLMKASLASSIMASLPYRAMGAASLVGAKLNDKFKTLRSGDALTKEEVATRFFVIFFGVVGMEI